MHCQERELELLTIRKAETHSSPTNEDSRRLIENPRVSVAAVSYALARLGVQCLAGPGARGNQSTQLLKTRLHALTMEDHWVFCPVQGHCQFVRHVHRPAMSALPEHGKP